MTGWVDDIEKATLGNDTFRTVLFTGKHLQMTVMCLLPGEEIGVEKHDDLDQFIRIEEGAGQVQMGPAEDDLSQVHDVEDDWAAIIPAAPGTTSSTPGPARCASTRSTRRRSTRRGTVHQTRRRPTPPRPSTTTSCYR